jgi:hypothetical protein
VHNLNFLDLLRYRRSKSRIEQTTIRGGFPRQVTTGVAKSLEHLAGAIRHSVFLREANKEKAPAARPGLGWDLWCHGGSPVTNRTVTDTRFLLNSAMSEIRVL